MESYDEWVGLKGEGGIGAGLDAVEDEPIVDQDAQRGGDCGWEMKKGSYPRLDKVMGTTAVN